MLRRRDFLIMEYTMGKGINTEELLSMSRVRGLLCTIVVSGIGMKDSKHLEEFATARTLSRKHVFRYNVPHQHKTTGQCGYNSESNILRHPI